MHLLQKGRVSEVALEHIDPVRKLVKVAKSSELFRSIGKWGINAVRNQHSNYICTTGSKGNSVQTRLTYNCAHLSWTKESLTVEFGKKNVRKAFFHKVSDVLIVTIGRYWLIHDGIGSVWGSTG